MCVGRKEQRKSEDSEMLALALGGPNGEEGMGAGD